MRDIAAGGGVVVTRGVINSGAIGSGAVGLEASFSPKLLFVGGVAGVWYDFTDISTLWQDTARTTPVTASGQTVAGVTDKSGNGNHLAQATVAARPVYTESGGLRFLLFDGVNDGIACTFGAALTQPTTIWTAARANALSPASLSLLFDGASTGRHIAGILTAGTNLFESADSANLGNASQTLVAATDFVSSHLFNTTSSQIRVNSGAVTSGNVGTATLSGITIGARFSLTNSWNGRVYGFAAVNGNAEAASGDAMRRYMASRCGAVL